MPSDRPFVFDADARELGLSALESRYEIRTICNVLRRIHLIARNHEVTQLCAEAIWMAKRMNARLYEYKRDWDRGLWVKESTPLPWDDKNE